MSEQLLPALFTLLGVEHLLFLLLGTLLGLVIGILPGLGGIAGLSLLLPFVYGGDPTLVLPMMIGLLAVTNTSDTFPAVLLGIPGTSSAQATIMDGFPLARRGEAARALGAAFSASLLGGPCCRCAHDDDQVALAREQAHRAADAAPLRAWARSAAPACVKHM